MSKPFDSTIEITCPCGATFYAEAYDIDYTVLASEFIDDHKDHSKTAAGLLVIPSGLLPPDVPGPEMMATSKKLFPRRYPPKPSGPNPGDPT